MARFSIGGGEQGAGSSSRSQKRRRTDPLTPALSDGFSEDGGASRGEGYDTEDGRRGGGGEHGHGDSSGEDDEGWGNEEVEEGGSGEEEGDDSDGEGGGGENDDEEVEEQRVELHRGVPAPEKSITFTLTDTDVLDCAICYEPLTSPIYQVNQLFIFSTERFYIIFFTNYTRDFLRCYLLSCFGISLLENFHLSAICLISSPLLSVGSFFACKQLEIRVSF